MLADILLGCLIQKRQMLLRQPHSLRYIQTFHILNGKDYLQTGYAVDATYTTSCAPPPMMEDLGLGSVAIARPASL